MSDIFLQALMRFFVFFVTLAGYESLKGQLEVELFLSLGRRTTVTHFTNNIVGSLPKATEFTISVST